ncbi:homogentisate phytyltransferase 1, chloroplastic isoform X1 [Beta vulgaris subsp. vulgaris]|uniref:homogentisate phytyltransferase 1, chloroplastic isoform X1 n=1 Tax=Beta vulgaris subsp. vulgaris TaxID=3555 RepID=UPI0020370437|nr:homogentisate phytyltransferase 1, chloroplastic isoform X1 [Beta vulgaris subsp. vulgaris]
MDSMLVGSLKRPSKSLHTFPATVHLPSLRNSIQGSRSKEWSFLERFCSVRFPRHLVGKQTVTGQKRSIVCPTYSRKRLVVACCGQPLESEPDVYDSKTLWNSLSNFLDAFYRFSRPHTVIGTALSIVSVSLLAVERLTDLSPVFFTGMFEAIVAALFMNIYIVGLNQISDIEIDKVNKPYLPLASGEYSTGTGILIVTSFAILSFWLWSVVGSWPLFWALFVSFMLGTAYSINLPMLRWKRFAVVAAMCILAVRAVIVQIAFFLHMQMHVFGRPAVFSRPLIFATAFMSFFSVVIALFKDIPDMEGDKIYGIKSFTVRLGQKRVFWICIVLLQMAYTVAILVGASSSFLWSKLVTVAGHSILAALLWRSAKSTDLSKKAAITSFYMFIWKLFYAEYLLIPLVR